jgi:hypothetical protein
VTWDNRAEARDGETRCRAEGTPTRRSR